MALRRNLSALRQDIDAVRSGCSAPASERPSSPVDSARNAARTVAESSAALQREMTVLRGQLAGMIREQQQAHANTRFMEEVLQTMMTMQDEIDELRMGHLDDAETLPRYLA